MSRQLPFAIAKQCEYLEALVEACSDPADVKATIVFVGSKLGFLPHAAGAGPSLEVLLRWCECRDRECIAKVLRMIVMGYGYHLCQDDHVRRILLSCQRLQRLDLSGGRKMCHVWSERAHVPNESACFRLQDPLCNGLSGGEC